MKDMVPKGTGNSRFLRSSIAADITHEELVALLRSGKFPVDFAGLNSAGIQVQGSAYNKGNVLPDSVCSALGIPTTSEPKDAFLKVSSDRGLKIGDSILTENTMPSNFLPCDGRYIDRHTYSSLDSIMSAKHGFFRTKIRDVALTIRPNLEIAHKIVCNPEGYYVICSFIKEYNSAAYESMYLGGRLYSGGASAPKTILKASSFGFSTSNNAYSDCTFTPDGDVVILIHSINGSSATILVYSNTGNKKVEKSISTTLPNPRMGLTSDVSGNVWVVEYSSNTSSTKYYKIDSFSNPELKLISTQTTDVLPSISGVLGDKVTYYRIGKIASYYFVGSMRGTSLSNLSPYSIGGVDSSKILDMRQDDSSVLYLLVRKGSNSLTDTWYKTTNGTTFTQIGANTGTIFDYPDAYWGGYYLSDGMHIFRPFSNVSGEQGYTLNEYWYKKTPMDNENVYVSQDLGYMHYNFLHPHSKFLTDDGVVIPYFEAYNPDAPQIPLSNPHLGLFKKDYQIKMPTYEVGGTYMQMKVKT